MIKKITQIKTLTCLIFMLFFSMQGFSQSIPEVLYYKFDGSGSSVPNLASTPPTGTATATIMGGVTQGGTGKCGGALIGTGVSSTNDYLNTGWAPNLGGANWTISMWTSNITPSTTLFYVFGDVNSSSLRCFTNGIAGVDNFILRGAGMTDVLASGAATVAPHMTTFVYDNTLLNIKAYVDGVLVNTVAQTAPNLTGAGPFKVMGYSSNVGSPAGGLMDDFRIYSHALTAAEVANLYTAVTASVTGFTPICEGASTSLTATNASNYTWEPGTVVGININVSPTVTTTYTVTGSDAGCAATATTIVNVNPTPVVSLSSSSVCVGATINASPSTGGTWTSSDPSATIDNAGLITGVAIGSAIFTFVAAGTGCSSTTSSVIINELPTVTANITPSSTVNDGTSITFNGGSASTYTWAGAVAVTDNTAMVATLAANGTYTVTGTDANTCVSISTISLVVNPIVIPSFSVNSLLWGASPFQDSLWSINTNTWSVVDHIAPSLAGFIINGINSLAFDPCGLKTYAILKINSITGRMLVTIDLPTGVCTQVGNLGDKFSSITFDKTGQLWGATGNGATAIESLFTIDKATAIPTLKYAMGSGADGEIICYNPADEYLYHWSGNSTVIMEKMATTDLTYTPINIPVSGASSGETFGAYCLNPTTFLIANIASEVKSVSTSGAYGNSLIATPDDLRGLVKVPTFGNDVDTLCAIVDSVTVASDGAQWFSAIYNWGDGNIDTLAGNVSIKHAYATSGNKTINVLLWNGTCLADTIWTKVINVRVTPVVTITGLNGFCPLGDVTLTGSSGGSSQWYLNGAIIPTGITNTITVNAAGVYNMLKTNLNGCADSAAVGKTIVAFTSPSVAGAINPGVTCLNTSVLPTGAGALTYTWNNGLTENTPFVATASSLYVVTGTDANGCTATNVTSVSVTPASGFLAASTSNQPQTHADDMNINYYNLSCDLIATVDDGAAGNILGLTTSTVNVDAIAGFHNGQPFVRRWYQITPTSNGSADVTLYINQSDFDDYNSVVVAPYLPMPTSSNNSDPNIANIRITKNSDLGLGNLPVLFTPTVNWNGTYWELSFNTPSFSQFRVHSPNPFNAPLSFTLLSFAGTKEANTNVLNWATSQEQNNAYFNVQHSQDGKVFTTISQINTKAINGNSTASINYEFVHQHPNIAHNYYRLQQIDIDGKINTESKIIDLFRNADGSFVTIYPNPTSSILNVELSNSNKQRTTIKLLDMTGRLIQAVTVTDVITQLDISKIAVGIYQIQIVANNKIISTQKVEKQ